MHQKHQALQIQSIDSRETPNESIHTSQDQNITFTDRQKHKFKLENSSPEQLHNRSHSHASY